jgi:predicted MFS family arabinose efflux permease
MSGTQDGPIVTGQKPQSEWRVNWFILIVTIICYTCNSLPVSVLGALVKPLGVEFGWSRAAVASALTIIALGTMVVGPFVGHFVNRVGPRRVALIGLGAQGVGFLCFAIAGPSIYSWYFAAAVYGFVQPLAGAVVFLAAIVSLFDKHRGLALGATIASVALTYGFMPSVAVEIISHLGWRAIFFTFATFNLIIAWPLALKFFHCPLDRRLSQDEKSPTAAVHVPPEFPFEMLRTRLFWLMAAAFGIGASAVSALVIHFQPIMIDSGMSAAQAAAVFAVYGPASVLGRFGIGYCLDRFPTRMIACIALAFPLVSYGILLAGAPSLLGAYVVAAFIGIAAGAESDLLAYLVSRYFREVNFAAVYAILLAFFTFGYGLSPVVAGRVFDTSGSYYPMFVVLMGMTVLGVLIMARLGPQPARAE